MDKSGETAPHLAIGTLEFRIISKFIDYLGPEVQDIRDETGNTLLHYAVGSLDEATIYDLMIKVCFHPDSAD
jgi:ankyrin repeat protein